MIYIYIYIYVIIMSGHVEIVEYDQLDKIKGDTHKLDSRSDNWARYFLAIVYIEIYT